MVKEAKNKFGLLLESGVLPSRVIRDRCEKADCRLGETIMQITSSDLEYDPLNRNPRMRGEDFSNDRKLGVAGGDYLSVLVVGIRQVYR
jgi:hypothetical protein